MALKSTIVTDSISTSKKLFQCICDDSVYTSEELLIQCTLCKHWLHLGCLGFENRTDAPDDFICVFCGTAISVVHCNGGEEISDVPVLNEDSEHVVCCCGEQIEVGFMIQCESCFTWQHGKCMALKHGENPANYRCLICNLVSNKLVEDQMDHNGEKTEEIEPEKDATRTKDGCSYNCKICGVDFDNGRALIYHKSYEKCTSNVGKRPQKYNSDSQKIEAKGKVDKNVSFDSLKNGNSCEINENRGVTKNVSEKKLNSVGNPGEKLSTKEAGKSSQITSVTDDIILVDSIDFKTQELSAKTSVGISPINKKSKNNILDGNIETIHDVEMPLTSSYTGKISRTFPDTKSFKNKSKTDSSRFKANSGTIYNRQQPISEDDDDVINCLCGSNFETGLMVQCEICQTWQHTDCIGIDKGQNIPKIYFCYDCMNKGCFSMILEMCNISVETIADNFHHKFVKKGRKRKRPQSDFKTNKRKQKEDSSTYSEESERNSSPSEDSFSDKSYSTPQKKEKKSKKVTPRHTQDPLSRPLIRSSTSELAAIKHLLSTILSETRIFTHLLPRTSNFKRVAFSEVLELLPTPFDFPSVEITSDLNETLLTTSVNFLSSVNYPYGNQLIINVGAPVTCLAWAPSVFSTDNTIYLASTTQRNVASKDHLFPTPLVEFDNQSSDVVQIWSISQLFDNDVCLALGLILKQGKVMDMEWCPSGCFDNTTDNLPSNARLGLLLVALNTGDLGIISVPHPVVLNESETHSLNWFHDQFYEVKNFDATLSLEDEPLLETSNKCLCCDWSLQNSHSRVVAGFQTGIVAVWNIKTKLFCKNNRIRPILTIKAHVTPVISVVWSPQHPYLFATASHDAYTTLIWDMRQAQVHSSDLNSTQVCITWCMCWPINYLRPICGIEVLPKKNEFSWYGNLITNSFRSFGTSYRHQLGGHYQQCPTISSVGWCRKDCSLLLGSFSGELIFLYSFYSCKKTKLRAVQARKLIDISIRSDEDNNQLTMDPFDIDKIQSVSIDFNFSSFRNEETLTEFQCSEKSQEALVKRLMKPVQPKKSKSNTQFLSQCKKCGKKFLSKTAIEYHQKHDVCKDGSVKDNRGNFFKPTVPSVPHEKVADKLMLQQIKSKKSKKQVLSFSEKKSVSKSPGKPNVSTGTLDSSPRFRNREKPPDKYQECSHSQIKQVKWFPCEPYQNVFAVGTGLGLITISYLPET